ncbi:branched-chain amino acid aminotransferase [Actinomadura sp. 6N118]|uniref:branched-chain amino acid aminotransferase n=1 Tax=Actinomadura sp. 6N118 TaxID=3375151 RepID=UPI0037B9BD34
MSSLEFETRQNATPVAVAEREALLANLGFGRTFTDHMVSISYSDGKGWYNARLEPYAPLRMDPATAVLHYAQSVFEGLKAYRAPDGGVVMFRPDANAARFVRSAERMAMPPLPPELFLHSLRVLIEQDRDWVPGSGESSLYLRPIQYASEVYLGVRPALEYQFLVLASPVGAIFAGEAKPCSIWLEREYNRSGPGGTGAAKCGGNYASSLLAQAEAMRHGCEQVVFLDATEHRHFEELGGMNVFFVLGDTLVTPPLTDTILPGITRDSVITLARHRGLTVEERSYSIDEFRSDAASGALTEMFACGTAAVITPIARLLSADGEIVVGDGGSGRVTTSLRSALLDIQYGRAEDEFGWVQRIV